MAKIQIPADLMMEVARRLRVGKDQLKYILEQNFSRTAALMNEFEGETASRFRSLHEENTKALNLVPLNLQKAADELETIVNKFVDVDSGIVHIPDLIGEKSIYDYAGDFFKPDFGTIGPAHTSFAQLNEMPDAKYVSSERPPREEPEKGFGDHVSDFFEGAWKPLSTLGNDIVKLGEQMEEDPVGTIGGMARDAIAAPVEGAVNGATFGWNYLWGTGGAREQVKEYVETEQQKIEGQGPSSYAGIAASTFAMHILGRRLEIKGKLGEGKKYTLREEDQDKLKDKVSEGTPNANKKFSDMSADEQLIIAKQYSQKAPIEIPENANMKAKSMADGYEQITYKWNDGTYKYEVRWHTRTSGAPADQGNTWVIQRTIPGSGGNKPQSFFKIGETEWVEGYKWYDAIAARKAGAATPEQVRILDQGHWKE
jgi:uncharacterized protein YukE